MRSGIKHLLLRYRGSRRALVWIGILRGLRAPGWLGEVGLAISAAADTIIYALRPQRAQSPIALFGGIVYAPALDTRFHVRSRTDDIYNVVPFGEADVHDAILDRLGPGDIFVDVGANVGYYTILGARRVGQRGKVIAIEAVASTAAQLRKNLQENHVGNVEVVEAAVYDGSRSRLTLAAPRGVLGMTSVVRTAGGGDSGQLTVEATTLDAICADLPRVTMLKLDIEGSEYEALKGGIRTLQRTHSVVLECSRRVRETTDLLHDHGFIVERLQFTSYLLAKKQVYVEGGTASAALPS